jgi:ubiquinone/menaquinone biosynthesis C-methylase UbiE
MADNLITYYSRRAPEYDAVYEKPERQAELRQLEQWLQQETAGRRVLEVACGTGYWTRMMAPTATSVLATDASPEMIALAQAKMPGLENVTFRVANLYELEPEYKAYDTVFGGFIWSHIHLQNLADFLVSLHTQVGKGGRVLFLDNTFVPGTSPPISRTDREGNTYQTRQLEDGARFQVLKNYPVKKQVTRLLNQVARDLQITRLSFYWTLSYTLAV